MPNRIQVRNMLQYSRLFPVIWVGVSLLMMGTVAPPVYGQEWESSGGNVYYNDGNVGVGTTGPSYDLEIQQHVNRGFSVGLGGDNGRIWTEYTNNGPTLVFYDRDDRGIFAFAKAPRPTMRIIRATRRRLWVDGATSALGIWIPRRPSRWPATYWPKKWS
jgi:hypothetical protein